MKHRQYHYIGVVNLEVSSDRFVHSVFERNNRYFIQVQSEGYIINFKRTNIPESIIGVKKDLWCSIGDPVVYSFLTSTGELIFGNRSAIQASVLMLLNSNELNVHAKLLLSNFLGLYKSTLKFIDLARQDLGVKGINSCLSEEYAFSGLKILSKTEPSFLHKIFHVFGKYKKILNSIKLNDIVFIRGSIAYFQGFKMNLGVIANKQTLLDKWSDKKISQIINLNALNNNMNLKEVMHDKEAFSYILCSEYVKFLQPSLEKAVTNVVMGNEDYDDESIIIKGINVDKIMQEIDNVVKDYVSIDSNDYLNSRLMQEVETVISYDWK